MVISIAPPLLLAALVGAAALPARALASDEPVTVAVTEELGVFGASVMYVRFSNSPGLRVQLRPLAGRTTSRTFYLATEFDFFLEHAPSWGSVAARTLIGAGTSLAVPGGTFRHVLGGSYRLQAMPTWGPHPYATGDFPEWGKFAMRHGPGFCSRWSVAIGPAERPRPVLGASVCLETLPGINMLSTYGSVHTGVFVGVDLPVRRRGGVDEE